MVSTPSNTRGESSIQTAECRQKVDTLLCVRTRVYVRLCTQRQHKRQRAMEGKKQIYVGRGGITKVECSQRGVSSCVLKFRPRQRKRARARARASWANLIKLSPDKTSLSLSFLLFSSLLSSLFSTPHRDLNFIQSLNAIYLWYRLS